MVDYENDGIGDSLDTQARVLGMELARIVEAAFRAARDARDQALREEQEHAKELAARYEAQATMARADLGPVMSDRFWKDADQDEIRGKYALAAGLAEVDERFVPFKNRIEERAKALHDLSPQGLLEGPVPPGPRPMNEEQLRRFVREVPPSWYKVWASERTAAYDRVADPQEQHAAHAAHTALVRADMTHWRDTGTLSENARRVQGEWLDGAYRTWRNRKVDPREEFVKLTDAQRAEYGWRPGGPKITGPLDVDDARLLAATAAPAWYRVQEIVAQDVAPALRERLESRLVEDMTRLRDAGRVDTPSAREEWARFSGHPLSVQGQDPNESLAQFRERREQAFLVHWNATEADRDHVAEPHGEHVGKPMSVAQAEEFAERFAPDWLRERHRLLMEEAGRNEDPARAAWEQTNLREQFRYAMEEARDTGGLSHPYVASLRGNAAFMGVDESDGMRHVPEAERVRFGGPAARPMSHEEAQEVMAGWAPEWYRDQMNRTLRDNNLLDDSAKRIELDALRADMTQLRDRGVLNSDHAKRLWAASQPGFDPEDPDSRKAMDVREQTWVETMGTREGPKPMDPNNRERFGGRRDLDTQPIPVVERPARPSPGPAERRSETPWKVAGIPATPEPEQVRDAPAKRRQGPVYDSVERRELDAARARARGMSQDVVDGMTAVDYNHPRPAGKESFARPKEFGQWVENAKLAAKSKDRHRGR